jgi:hypothetical protein
MKWIDAELKVFKAQYAALKERIARESAESAHAANVLEQSKAITLAVRPSISPPHLPEPGLRRALSLTRESGWYTIMHFKAARWAKHRHWAQRMLTLRGRRWRDCADAQRASQAAAGDTAEDTRVEDRVVPRHAQGDRVQIAARYPAQGDSARQPKSQLCPCAVCCWQQAKARHQVHLPQSRRTGLKPHPHTLTSTTP